MSYAEIPRGTAARGQEPSVADGMTPPERPRPPSSRRRDKPQLSCNACRSRKVRCDRLHPCSNCASRGLGSSCVYGGAAAASQPDRPPRNAPVQDRINQLESLVLSLMQQTSSTPSPHAWPPDTPSLSGPPADHTSRPDAPPRPLERKAESEQLSDDGPEQIPRQVSPSPSDYGSIRIRKSGASYVSGAHWAAVLDSIAELRDHFEHDDEGYSLPADTAGLPANFPSPQLLYGGCPLYVTPASILESLPSRPVVDRLVSRYFNDLDMAPGVPHSGKFLREYEEFWGAPQSAPIVWVGLLFSMMCLSSQFHQLFLASPNTLLAGGRSPQQPELLEMQTTINLYREKIMQCLVLGHYTKGGPYILETLILYFMVEVFLAKDTEVGIWVLVGNITQIAMHSGYHWDAKHFPNISPFAGEMRRRVWAVILQLDFTISSQLGLPRVIRESQTDTNEPRNLADSDFDEFTAELPPCRPETEATPILYTLAKLRLLHVGCKVADMATEPRPYSYAQIRDLDEQLNAARDALPSCLKWDGLASCIAVSPQVIIQRIWLEVTMQRQRIVLHKRFLVASRLEPKHAFSRSTCLKAAMNILELQHLIDEETQIDGRLYQSRWRVSFSFIQDFLLATSTLCFYLQARDKGQKDQPEDTSQVINDAPVDIDRIRHLLRTSQVIWLRESSASREARKAAAALDYVLGDSGVASDSSGPPGMPSGPSPGAPSVPYFSGFPNLMPGVDFGGVDLGVANDMPSWQRFAHNFTGDVESWAGANSSQYMNMDLES